MRTHLLPLLLAFATVAAADTSSLAQLIDHARGNDKFLSWEVTPEGNIVRKGGGPMAGPTDEMSPEQKMLIVDALATNRARLESEGKLSRTYAKTLTNFQWPLRKGAGRTDPDFHGISNYIDENPAFPNQVQDYTCGTRTYDLASGYNHQGTDIFLWPFSWKKMDDQDVVIVAGAPGTILFKHDGEFDRSCGLNNNPWNAVYVQHADGSVAWYGHMKSGSPTVKGVGETVQVGEYLGSVGSSGSSTGPHLHLELYDSTNALVDPWTGACNFKSKAVKWATERPYRDTNINALIVGTAAAYPAPACPSDEISYATDFVTAGSTVYFTVAMRDQLSTTPVSIRVLRPNATVYFSSSYSSSPNDYSASYAYWLLSGFPGDAGAWTFEATIAGHTVTKTFQVGGGPNFGTPTAIAAFAGGHQAVAPNGTFALPLTARVTDSLGRPVSNAKVTFTVPNAGATAILSSPNALTDATGMASVTAIANNALGPYNVSATVVGAPLPVTFLLNHANDPTGDADNDGIPNGVEGLEGRNAAAKDNDIFTGGAASNRLFAMQQYRDFLSREGDAAGIQGWTDILTNAQLTRPQVIDSFLSSNEFAGFVAPVVRLYFATFLRVPDYAGLTFNAGLVRAGTVTVVQLADFFTQSPEFMATYGALNDTQFVTLLYNNVLHRAPDTAGLNGWVSLLQGGYTRGQVLVGFSDSTEYQASSANQVFVTMMYAGMLRRTPEPNGFNGWVSGMDSATYSRTQVINGFFLSTEYYHRFLS
jgi:Domain of unknown function (DUF4214)/Peptidase family M23/Bacterial Ig-like domain (group 1)